MRSPLKSILLGASLLLGAGVAAAQYDPAAERAKIDAILQQEIVTADCAVPHVMMGQSDLEGRIDCEGGKKADFRVGLGGSTMPENLGDQRVAISVSPGVRADGAGASPAVGIKNPAGGHLLLNTAASTPVSMQVDPFSNGGTLPKYAQYPNAPSSDALADTRFIEQRFGVRANGTGTRSSIVFDHTDSALNRIYALVITKGGKSATIEMTVHPSRADFAYRFLAKDAGLTTLDFGLRSSDTDQLDASTVIKIDASGQYAPQSRTGVSPSLCSPNATTLCLQGGKYQVNVAWRDFQGHTGQGQATRLSNESGDFWFFGPNSNEVIIKVIDGCGYNNRDWVSWRALSNVEMDITVSNLETNQTLTYHNPLGFIPNGHLDIDTIFYCDGAGPASEHFDTDADLPSPGVPQLQQYTDASLIGPCLPDDDRTICLQNDRFRVEGTWEDFAGHSGNAHMIQKNDGSGYAWFFNSTNYEALFKMVNGCSFNGNTWVSIAAPTNTRAVFTFTDTWTGDVYRQTNGLGVDFPTNLDIDTNFTHCGVAPFSTPVNGKVEPMSAATDALKAALASVYGAMTVTTLAGTVPSGILAPHIGPDLKVDGATLIGKRLQIDADGAIVYSNVPTLDAVLECLPGNAGTTYALRVDSYSSTIENLAAADVVSVSMNGTSVSNNGVHYATGTASGTLGSAIKTICESSVVASPQQAHHLSVVPRSVLSFSCNNILFNSGCEQYTGAFYSLPDGAQMTVHADAKFKNGGTLGVNMTDTYNGSDLFQLHFQATDRHAFTGTSGYLGYLPVGEILDASGITVGGNSTGGFTSPADGRYLVGYGTTLFQNAPSWITNPWPFE